MNRNRKKKNLAILSALFTVVSLLSCIDEDMKDCGEVNIRFDYSYNILSSNAFSEQVNRVTLYVFDQENVLVEKRSSGELHFTNDYSISMNKLKTGKYKFVAWAESSHIQADKAKFSVPELTVGLSVLADLSYYVKRTAGIQNNELNNLLVGITETKITNASETQHVTVAMKKVNKKVRVVLLPVIGGGETPDVNDYEFKIVDEIGNGHIKYDYSLLRDEPITYRPYYSANVTPKPSETLSPTEINRAAVVEISTSRLMTRENEVDNPRLIITSVATDEAIARINLPWFFSLTGMESHKSWGLQEYLDRQDEYSITLFMQSDTWMQATIIINGWVVNNIEVDW